MSDLPLDDRGRLLSALAARLAALPPDRSPAWRFSEAMRLVVEADGVAITVQYLSDSRTTVCASDDLAQDIEDLQELVGEGPGYEAARSGQVVVALLDGATSPQWPMLSHLVEERYGLLTLHAVPLHGGGSLGGVTTLYTRDQRALTASMDSVRFLADTIGAALLADAAEASEDQSQVGDTWTSRSVVHQATGMVMAQVLVTADDALALLRAHAYASNTDVRTVAEQVVARTINFSSFDVEGD